MIDINFPNKGGGNRVLKCPQLVKTFEEKIIYFDGLYTVGREEGHTTMINPSL